MKCSECKNCKLVEYKGSPSRYYCQEAYGAVGLISRCDRYSNELKIKTSPKWCPLKQNKEKV